MKKISAKVGTYTDAQGKEKGRYLEIGVILKNDDGQEYALIKPTTDLAGVMMLQRIMAPQKKGESVIASIFDEKPKTAEGDGGDYSDDIPF